VQIKIGEREKERKKERKKEREKEKEERERSASLILIKHAGRLRKNQNELNLFMKTGVLHRNIKTRNDLSK
jgi:hypothetical protein